MKLGLFAGLILAGALPLATTQLAAPAAQAEAGPQNAQRLWELMLQAKGGRARLHEVRSIEEVDAVKRIGFPPAFKPGHKDTGSLMVRLFAFPDREWQWYDAGESVFGLSLDVYNLSLGTAYLAWGSDPVRTLSAQKGEDFKLWEAQLVYLSESEWVRPQPVRVITDDKMAKQFDIVETHFDGDYFRADFLLDKRTHLPARMVTYRRNNGRGLRPILTETYEFLKYVSIDGVIIPSPWAFELITGDRPVACNFQVRLNVPYREEAFTTPPSVAAGPYAWQAGNAGTDGK
jgi:hypothetical protein